MSELLKIVLSLSLSGTLLFFIILALKPLYKNKLSKRWQYYIWLIVVVRMLLPFTPETNLVGSIFEYLGSTNVEIIETSSPANNNQSNFIADNGYIAPNTESHAPQSNTATAPAISIQAAFAVASGNLWILWAVIAFALLLRKITMYQSFVHFVKAGRTEVSDIEILNLLADTGEAIGVKRPVELFTNPLISSPMLLGFLRPHIILPSIELDKNELAYILRHELTHYKHMDMFYKWLVQVTVCLHWFNPFAYMMAKEINKCCELSCDEAIIKAMDKDEKKAYGDTLLNSLKAMGNYNDKHATVTLTEGAEQLKERLDAIMKFKKKGKVTATITLVLTVVLCIGATAVGAYATPQQQTDTIKVAENQENNTNQNIITVPIDIKAVKNGAFIWLGEFNLSYGDKMYYDVLAEKGNGLQTGFAAPEDDPLNRTYFTISNKREDGILDTKGDFIFAAPVKPGQYNLFIRATDGDLINVNGSITIEYTEPPTAIPKIPVDLNSSNKSEVSYEEAYVQWDVTYIDGIYYYKNEPVRVFMDLRADSSFANFSYNKNGSVDLRLVRNSSDSIVKAEHMTKAEAEEILRDIEQDPPIDEDIKRLTPEEAPDDVRTAIDSCDDKSWYVIEGHGRQYIYYNNLPHNYAYQYEPNQNSISIVDIGTSTGNCVLLSVPANSNLSISYNSETVTYTNVPQSNAKENIAQPVSYVIECVSEEVVVKQGGTEFKLEIDKASQNNYTIRDNRNIPYGDRYYRYNKWDIVVERNKDADPSAVFSPTITLTIPKNIDEKSILLVTENGNIQVNGLNNASLTVNTQSGEIDIKDTNATFISAESETGNVNMKNITSTGDIEADSESGSVSMLLGNSDSQYSVLINTETTAGITINGQKYDGGHYAVGNDAKQKVMLNGNSNSFVVSNIHLSNDSIIGVSSNINPQQSGQSSTDYWTIEEFTTFMESQEQQCKKLLENGNITQNEFDTFASVNKGVLKEIQNGAKVSKSATGSIGNGIGI